MPIPKEDIDEFAAASDGAQAIIDYREHKIPAVTGNKAWKFEQGNVSEDGDSAYAVFSCRSLSPWGDQILTITGRRRSSGTWKISYSIDEAG